MIVFFATDLIWATRIKGTADTLGVACRPVRTPEMLAARLADSPVRAMIVDLDTPDVALELIGRLRGWEADRANDGGPPATGRVRIVAFGPHMAKDDLQAAREAGADDVLPRGAFDHNLPDIMLDLAGRAPH